MENSNFYCQKKCGGVEYKQGQMDEAISEAKELHFNDSEIKLVIKGVHQSYHQTCQVQCKTCAKIVADTQIKNKKNREKLLAH